jgi:P4 family phage/plasmid primase-like protien
MFSSLAPAYWAAGLPAIPLRHKMKMPAIARWSEYANEMPSEELRAEWLHAYTDGNIGLPLGPCSNMLALDLDSDDPRVLKVLMDIMPHSPWVRRGKKGAVYMFRYNGERTTRIKDKDGNTLMEMLARGAQVVLPPSIHPDTQRPYEANCELLSVLDQLVPLPREFDTMLRKGLIAAGFELSSAGANKVSEWVPSGGRDSALTSMAGLLARAVVKGERTLLEAIGEIEAWVATYTEKVVGDALDPNKGRTLILNFIRRDILEQARSLPIHWDAGMSDAEKVEMKTYFGDDMEEWSTDRILNHLTEKFTEIPRTNTTARTEVIEGVLVRLAKSQSLTHLDEDVILQFIHGANGRMVTIASMRKRVKELQASGIAGTDHTEIAIHLIKEMERYGEVRIHDGAFFQWGGSHWSKLEDSKVLGIIASEFGQLAAARKHNDHKGILATARNQVAQGLADTNERGINFANGFLNEDLVLSPHDPKYGCTYCMPYRYMPEGDAPQRFLGLLDNCWGSTPDYMDRVQALREAIAVTLFKKATDMQRVILLYGLAGTGKSVVKDIIVGLVPDEVCSMVPPQAWGDKFMATEMAGKMINICGELSESNRIAGDRFKLIVEGSEMMGQHKGQQIFKFKPDCAHWFASNHLPKTSDTSEGFNRRWLMLKFSKVITRDEKILRMDKIILEEEAEAIVAWAVPAIRDLIRNADYTLPTCHHELMEEMSSLNNSVRFFIQGGGVVVHPSGSPSKSTSERDLYSRYYGFCKLTAHAVPVQLKTFRQLMTELQSEFGFTLVTQATPSGVLASYVNLTLAEQM